MIGRDYAIQKIQEVWEVLENLVRTDEALDQEKMTVLMICLEKVATEFSLPTLETLQEKNAIATQDFLDVLQSSLFPSGFSVISVATFLSFIRNWQNEKEIVPGINDNIVSNIIESVNDYFDSTERLPILTVESMRISNGYDS